MGHENIAIRDFIEDIKKGEYVIPHFQRDFDWHPNMVADLFESILHNRYAGTILLWNLENIERELKMWDPLWGAEKGEKPTKAILDGQQRLSSVYYALYSPKKPFPNKTVYYYFYIDLDQLFSGNEDESMIYDYFKSPQKLEYFKKNKEGFIKNGRFPICLLSDKEFLDSEEYQDWLNKYIDSREELDLTALSVAKKIESILGYHFLTETLEKKEVKEICTIFANINSKGLKLDIFDLMNAFLYPKGVKLRKDWDELENDELKNVDQQMKVYILKLISLYKQRYCSSKFLYNLIPGSTIKDKKGNKTILVKDGGEFKKLWNNSIKYSEKARSRIMSSGINDFGAIKNTFIPNTTIIPVLGALFLNYKTSDLKNKISENEFWNKINKWYWCAVLSGDYSGSSDSIMSKDYREIIGWFKDDSKIPERVLKINSIFIEESLNLRKVKNMSSAQYCTILNLLAIKSAKDLFTGRILGNYPINEINDHHIFPTKCGLKLPVDEIDCILNRTLLWQETNNKIKNKKPSEYYKEILKATKNEKEVEKLMNTHLISQHALRCLINDDFNGFIEERNKTIKEELKKIIGIKKNEIDSSLISPDKEYDNEINYVSYIENCEDYIFIIDPYIKENSLRLIRKGLVNNRSIKEIKIITKPEGLEEDFKDSVKKFSKQMKNEGINVEIRVLVNPTIKNKLHDRYLITRNKTYNFVSADTVSRGQLSHIKEVSDITPKFNEFWENGLDIIKEWEQIINIKKMKNG